MYMKVSRIEKKMSINVVPGLNICFVLGFSEGDTRAVAKRVMGECSLQASIALADPPVLSQTVLESWIKTGNPESVPVFHRPTQSE